MFTNFFCQFFNRQLQKNIRHKLFFFFNRMTSKWYEASPRAKKIVYMFTMRSLEPCYLTIGGITVMSLQNFTSVRKIWFFYLPLKILNTNNSSYNSWDEFPDPASICLVLHHVTIVSIKWKFRSKFRERLWRNCYMYSSTNKHFKLSKL